jgi:hypothetical protein
MKTWKVTLVVGAIACLLISPTHLLGRHPPPPSSPTDSGAYAPQWPKTFEINGASIIVYQPQIKSWRAFRRIVADTAVSITPSDGKTVLGVVSASAETMTDVAARTVYVRDIQVMSARFPSLDAAEEALMQERVHEFYPKITLTISLDHMIANLEKVNEPARATEVSTQAPTILVSESPAIVLVVEGKPILAPIPGTSLQYAINTNWNLFYDESDYYLLDGKTWLKSKQLDGHWAVAKKLPTDMARLPADQWGDVLKEVPPSGGNARAPKVFFTEKPSELIVFKGQAVYSEIPETQLSYATNTESSVFLYRPNNQVYVLISGRWFSAPNLDGPWVYAGNDLPADFAMIPPGHSYSGVLVSVPATQEAGDAVLLSQVPTSAVVNRAAAEAQVKVVYVGAPQFVPIATTTMFYAVNTRDKVIRVGDRYYLCYRGIWFVSTTPTGVWRTADFVPAVIYTIPPSSPVYNVTYVTVSNPTPTTIVTSYSSGYMGVFVAGGAIGVTVVYGTGYYYPPYVYWGPRPVFYPYPYTYGVAAVYNPYFGGYVVGRAVYGPYGSVGTAAWYNPATGRYGRVVTVQTANGGRTYAQTYNPWTGTYAATSQGHNQYSQWGSSVVTNGNNWARTQHVTNSRGTAGTFRNSKGAAGAGFSGSGGNSGFVAKGAKNNVYAGADGHVYKRDSDGTWSKWNNGSWTPVQPPTRPQSQRQSTNPSNSQGKPGREVPNTSTARSSSPNSNPRATPNRSPDQMGDRGSNSWAPTDQLQNDWSARGRGDQMEQSRSRFGSQGGSRNGGRRR